MKEDSLKMNKEELARNLMLVKDSINSYKGMKIEVKEINTGDFPSDVGRIIEIDGWIDLIPYRAKEKTRSICGTKTREVVKWSVMTYTDIPAIHYHKDGSGTPPDVDEVIVADNLSLCSACKKAWVLIGINSIDTVFENDEYARMQDEEERLEKSGCFADSY